MTRTLMRFDYFYGQEVEQYTFLRVPKTLFTDPYYYELSNEAKLLYSMMLERMQLSIANGWFDEKNRAFIYYKAKTIMNDMHCHSQKCAKLISELEAIGLIQKEKQGLGMPDRIYVMNFATMLDQEMDMHAREKETEDEGTEEDEIPDIPNSHLQRCENQIPEDVKNKAAEIRKTKPNNTEYSNTENNNLINHICRRPDESPGTDEIDKIDEMIHTIKGKLEYDFFAKQKDGDSKQYCELCNLILDTVSINRQSVRIDKEDIPINAVRKRFLMLTQDSIENAVKNKRTPEVLPHFSCHILRHTICARLCENEENVKFIQDFMGHADITTTMDIYAEFGEKKKQEKIASLDGLINMNSEEDTKKDTKKK